MSNKKATNIVKDALNLANLSNTNFCTHKELRDYINDGFTSIYNELIDKGNQYWLKEAFAQRNSDGYWLPADFYRAYNVKAAGSIVPRATRSASGYRIQNNQLFMDNYYGLVKLEYYPKPTFISFPASTIQLDKQLLSIGSNTLCWGPFVIDDSRVVTNIETKETFDLTALENSPYLIGNGWVAYTDGMTNERVAVDFFGNEISRLESNAYYVTSSSGNPYVCSYDSETNKSYIYSPLVDIEGPLVTFDGLKNNLFSVFDKDENIIGYWYLDTQDDAITSFHFVDVDENDYTIKPSVMKYMGMPRWSYCPDWSDNTMMFTTGNNVALLTPNTETGYLDIVEYKINTVFNAGLVEYNGNNYFLTASLTEPQLIGYEPDTIMEYPTNVFYRALAAYIAIQLLAKQSADTTNMQASFQSLVATLNQSKDASADYPTIATYY
jgi:hypothetical protein